MPTNDLCGLHCILKTKKERKNIYIVHFILRTISKHSHGWQVLPANYTMPAFPS